MTAARDMTEIQFQAALHRHDMEPTGFMGYIRINKHTSVCRWNAGKRRRDQLAYLLRERDASEQRNAAVST